MNYTAVNTTANIITAFGTLLTGIFAVIGIYRYISSTAVKNETIYGEEALERFRHIKHKLYSRSARELQPLTYGGGDIKVPRLVIEKISNYSKTIGDEWKGRKALIKFYEIKKGDEAVTIERWLI